MLCPNCKKETLEKVILLNVEVDYRPKCFGLWFDDNELRQAKDKKDENLNWLDIDLWRDKKRFNISRGGRLCPHCRMPLYEVQYDNVKARPVKSAKGGAYLGQFNGGVRVDLCSLCKGIWLDKGEFKKIIKYLKEKADYEVLYNFSRNLIGEFWEVFTGPEKIREEIIDFLTLLKLLHYKFAFQHPHLAALIGLLPK